MLTAYDYPTALALDECGLDLVLVGDSMGEVELGMDSTKGVTLAMMAHHVAAVDRGLSRTHLVADMTLGSDSTVQTAVVNARTLRDAGADSVKLEGAKIPQVEAIIAAGIPVMGHVGLLPQTAEVYRKHGTTETEADQLVKDAVELDEAGCYCIVIEAVVAEVATRVTRAVTAPTIGIAAGAKTDGQVLVSTDLVGQLPEPPPFVSPKANVRQIVIDSATAFADEVRAGR
jgi:3-methyl-2-oxobutanoate hydroxymethyltransferase